MPNLILTFGYADDGRQTSDTTSSCIAADRTTPTVITATKRRRSQDGTGTHTAEPKLSVKPGAQSPHNCPWRFPAHTSMAEHGVGDPASPVQQYPRGHRENERLGMSFKSLTRLPGVGLGGVETSGCSVAATCRLGVWAPQYPGTADTPLLVHCPPNGHAEQLKRELWPGWPLLLPC